MLRFIQAKSVWPSAAGLLVLVVAAFSAPRADAHALGADCRIRGESVLLEAYFSDDTPARHAKVEVKDAAGNVFIEGQTDDDGRWSFALPAAGVYQVAVDAGMGHRTTVALSVSAEQFAAGGTGKSEGVRVGAGPGREGFTRIPWLRVALGLGVIAGLAAALHLWFRRSQAAMPPPDGEAPQ
jgi:hypothetical protein